MMAHGCVLPAAGKIKTRDSLTGQTRCVCRALCHAQMSVWLETAFREYNGERRSSRSSRYSSRRIARLVQLLIKYKEYKSGQFLWQANE